MERRRGETLLSIPDRFATSRPHGETSGYIPYSDSWDNVTRPRK